VFQSKRAEGIHDPPGPQRHAPSFAPSAECGDEGKEYEKTKFSSVVNIIVRP